MFSEDYSVTDLTCTRDSASLNVERRMWCIVAVQGGGHGADVRGPQQNGEVWWWGGDLLHWPLAITPCSPSLFLFLCPPSPDPVILWTPCPWSLVRPLQKGFLNWYFCRVIRGVIIVRLAAGPSQDNAASWRYHNVCCLSNVCTNVYWLSAP